MGANEFGEGGDAENDKARDRGVGAVCVGRGVVAEAEEVLEGHDVADKLDALGRLLRRQKNTGGARWRGRVARAIAGGGVRVEGELAGAEGRVGISEIFVVGIVRECGGISGFGGGIVEWLLGFEEIGEKGLPCYVWWGKWRRGWGALERSRGGVLDERMSGVEGEGAGDGW